MNSMTMIRIGDVLTRPKALGFVTHTGVAIAPGWVLHNTPEKGEHATTVHDFSAGQVVAVHRTGLNPSVVIARARSVLGNPRDYHPIGNNCEHTVTKVIHGISKSPQVIFFAIIALLLGVLWLMLRQR